MYEESRKITTSRAENCTSRHFTDASKYDNNGKHLYSDVEMHIERNFSHELGDFWSDQQMLCPPLNNSIELYGTDTTVVAKALLFLISKCNNETNNHTCNSKAEIDDFVDRLFIEKYALHEFVDFQIHDYVLPPIKRSEFWMDSFTLRHDRNKV